MQLTPIHSASFCVFRFILWLPSFGTSCVDGIYEILTTAKLCGCVLLWETYSNMEFSSIARLPVIRNEGPFHSYFTCKGNWKNTLMSQHSSVSIPEMRTQPVHHPECSLLSIAVCYHTFKRPFLPPALFRQAYVDLNLLIVQRQLLVLAKPKRALSIKFLVQYWRRLFVIRASRSCFKRLWHYLLTPWSRVLLEKLTNFRS
jgi:hypothetical protein